MPALDSPEIWTLPAKPLDPNRDNHFGYPDQRAARVGRRNHLKYISARPGICGHSRFILEVCKICLSAYTAARLNILSYSRRSKVPSTPLPKPHKCITPWKFWETVCLCMLTKFAEESWLISNGSAKHKRIQRSRLQLRDFAPGILSRLAASLALHLASVSVHIWEMHVENASHWLHLLLLPVRDCHLRTGLLHSKEMLLLERTLSFTGKL